ncbi:unnamed protein product [Gongylonema pulchrum]|uniref:ANF_receptor domain-containing protein n=1 Tax=Gongylonema pulchrum TaxID=637853 RepID=A0A183EQ38_9BILA|nr:unnamed protein product [Gongylonema pulchrum]VDN40953.1 unnamed protein product [Gongylonema pulchrum]
MYLYGIALNRTLELSGESALSDGRAIIENTYGVYNGFAGKFVQRTDGDEYARYHLLGLNDDYEPRSYVKITVDANLSTLEKLYVNGATTIWRRYGGKVPPATPICGYEGRYCPQTFGQRYLPHLIVGCSCILAMILSAVFFILYTIR